MTLREFVALQERAEIQTEWQNWRVGMVASVIANVNRDPKHKPEPFTPQDFMPQKAEAEKEQTPNDVLAILRIWNAAVGGTEIIN